MFVIPGQEISDDTLISSYNTTISNKKIISSVLGTPKKINKIIFVDHKFTKKNYSGQFVIGRIIKKNQKNLKIDLFNKISFLNSNNLKNFNNLIKNNNLILAQIQKNNFLNSNFKNFGFLENGLIFQFFYFFEKKIFLKNDSLVCVLSSNFIIFIHENYIPFLKPYFDNNKEIKHEEIERIIDSAY